MQKITGNYKIRPTSGFMGHFRFRLVFEISRYKIDQLELGIANIEPNKDLASCAYVTWRYFGPFGVKKSIIFELDIKCYSLWLQIIFIGKFVTEIRLRFSS